jgi:predicted acylesterase/phospholipase RssA
MKDKITDGEPHVEPHADAEPNAEPHADAEPNAEPHADAEPNAEPKTPIEHLVFSGGGHNIFVMLGAIIYLKQQGYIHFNDIKTIDATSAGSLLAFIFMMGSSDSDLESYFIERPWDKLFDITPELLFQAFQEKGLFDISIFESIVNPIMKSVDIDRKITFQQLYEKNGIEFTVYATELNVLRLMEFSHISTPNQSIINAIYKSCAVPPVFKPVIDNDCCYLDGGVLANYPLNPFIERHLNKGITDNLTKVFGIKIVYEIANDSSSTISKKSNMGDYIFSLVKKIVQYREKDSITLPNELLIYGESMSITSIKSAMYSLEQRKYLFNEGKRYASVYYTYKQKELQCKY